jgi:hypothetical protein
MADQTAKSPPTPPLDEFHAAMKGADTVALWEWNDAHSNEPYKVRDDSRLAVLPLT